MRGARASAPLWSSGGRAVKHSHAPHHDAVGQLVANLGWLATALVGACIAAAALHMILWWARLRWTWLLILSPFPVLAWLLDSQAGVSLGLGCVGAMALGLGWHREALERRGEEAQRARDQFGIGDGIRALITSRSYRESRVRHSRIAIGTTRSRRVATIPFGDRQGTRGLILGSPGSGKTVTLSAIGSAYASEGFPVVAVDPKGDPAWREGLREAADSWGRRFYCWSPDGDLNYNPLGQGEPSEIADKALAAEEFTEPHYLRQAQRYLSVELHAMKAAGEWPASLTNLVAYFDVDDLELLAARAGVETEESVVAYLDSLSQRSRHELHGVRDRLAVLAESKLGPRLEPRAGREVDLAEVLSEGGLAYFQLDADQLPLLSQMLAASLVVDLVTLTGRLQGGTTRGLVLIDEFAAVATDEVSRLLGRSRSAGISVVLATQTLADLERTRGEAPETLRKQVLSQVDFVISHRQPEPVAAETLAFMTGTRPSWAVTRRVTGGYLGKHSGQREGSRTREREFIRHPDEFKRLGTGEAIVIEPASRCDAEHVRVWSR
jgi:type IV secretion system coupling TraD/TrwB family protein